MEMEVSKTTPHPESAWGDRMLESEEVSAILRLHTLGWGVKRIARELGTTPKTIRRYLRQGGWKPYRPRPSRAMLTAFTSWLEAKTIEHRGNADVVRQDLESEHGVQVSRRTVERAIRPYRRRLEMEARATLRFETPPGRQLQVDFGQATVEIGNEKWRIHVFVSTLGYSRRLFAKPFTHERQSAWLDGLEAAFRHFGGVTEEILFDNPRALVDHHNPMTREVAFNKRLAAFARHWGFAPKACAPYRARTKGKVENGVGYVKRNGLAGRKFGSFEELEAHLARWILEIADTRVHGTTGERPIDRFVAESGRLKPIDGRPSFVHEREQTRKVGWDARVEIDGNRYSVPCGLMREIVTIHIAGDAIVIRHGGREIARHPRLAGRRLHHDDPTHFEGMPGHRVTSGGMEPEELPIDMLESELQRPLLEYEALLGGRW